MPLAGKRINPIVAVRGIGEATDWFDNAYETESPGNRRFIVADTGDELSGW